ncbi:MAG: hypothetical protein JXO51_10675 [Candidatus Aminicenantes bacterium]|nr:hypothetical protein [Candidatus Aminicenantes bacterium]
MKRLETILILLLVILAVRAPALAGEGKFSGLMIGDYYNVLAHHDEAIEASHGFWLRRIYFTYDSGLSDTITMRFRLEMNSPGDFRSASTLVPFVKDAYLSASLGRHTLSLGLVGTQMYSSLEEFWGYRGMEKTPIDLFKFGNSRDLGLGLQGPLERHGKLSYSVVVGNGSGTKSETNRGKAAHVRLTFQPCPSLYLELYADYTDTGADSSVSILQAFAGLKGSRGRTGLNFGWRRSADHGGDPAGRSDLKFISLFGVYMAGPKLELVGRFDRLLDPNPSGSRIDYLPMADNMQANVALAGIGWVISEKVKAIPNLKYVFYDAPAGGERPDADLYAYLSLYFKF